MNIQRTILGALASCVTALALASPDHDHGHDAPKSIAASASPRFDDQSELFEVVGILGKDELVVYVDRFADNAPVLNAKIELESGTLKFVGAFVAEKGAYRFPDTAFRKPGAYPISLTVTAGEEIDILAGNLLVADPHAAPGHVHAASRWIYWAAGGCVLIVVAAFAFVRQRGGRRHV